MDVVSLKSRDLKKKNEAICACEVSVKSDTYSEAGCRPTFARLTLVDMHYTTFIKPRDITLSSHHYIDRFWQLTDSELLPVHFWKK